MIQFVPQGPQIPEEIVQALNNDNLVFFCGAGISMNNGLPSFKGLVEKVCEKLHISIDNNPLLKEAKEQKKYDIILDLIEGNQQFSVSRETLREQIIKILNNFTGQPDIHKALLDLSALPNNKGNRLVTTNFDKLFFEAGLNSKFLDSAPKLAPARKETWTNLTFLHGVIDENNDPDGKNLILTRRDFGLAYLYDNWASRFIIQLFQDFTVLFVGYSVNDPVMNYLVSAISYENKRRKQNDVDNLEIKPSIYAFAGYQKGERKKIKNKWEALGIEPIPYQIKQNSHSRLYNTIKKWAERKRTGLTGRRNWLKQHLKNPYKEETDGREAETFISALKIDEKLAEYLPDINLSSVPNERKPVDISWLKAFAKEKKESKNKNQNNSLSFLSKFESQTKNSFLEKLTCQTAKSSPYSLWEPLSSTEKNVAEWLLHHLDEEELIHWLIKQAPIQTGLISLHPKFKDMLKWQLKHIKENVNKKLDERKTLFWEVITTQKNHSQNLESFHLGIPISELNKNYSYEKVKEFLTYLEPMIGFEVDPYIEELMETDKIYKAKLAINASDYPYEGLTHKVLLSHAEDFTDLLKKAMELAEFAGIIQNGDDLFYFQKPSIEPHEQNRNYDSWTYLIDLVRDSFDLAMQKDKKLAKLLIHKWQFYPYSLFCRLILYAVTKYKDLSEDIVIKLFEEKPEQTLWSSSCKNEVLKFLRNRKHSEETIKKILPLIMKGSSRYDIDDNNLKEYKERDIYLRLHHLKFSDVQLPKDVEKFYKEFPSRYSFKPSKKEEAEQEGFSFYIGEPTQIGSEKRYHNMTCEKIFEEIKRTQTNTFPSITDKKENFRFLAQDFPDKAFKVLCTFSDNDTNRYPYWSVFISEISMITNTQKGNEYFLKSIQKIEKFNDDFLKECLGSLVHGLNMKGGLIYHKNKADFEKWWNKLWKVSIKDEKYYAYSDVASGALNSHLGKLSQTVFQMLWSQFPNNKIPKNKKIPEDVKKYFHIIIKGGAEKDSTVFYYFGSYLWNLWFLDKEWVTTNLIPLMSWKEKENICKAIWTGYLYHPNWSPDFLIDFKNEIFQLILNKQTLYRTDQKTIYKKGLCENIASIFFITTGGREMKNIFIEKESKKLTQTMDADILVSLSRQIRQSLKDSGDKSSNLWSEKIKPWLENFWPPQTNLQTSEIAKNLSFLILHCGEKFPEAFSMLKDNIKGVIQNNNDYIPHYINKKMDKELKQIFNHPEELLQLLNWNFPKNINPYMGGKEIKQILETLKKNNSKIEESPEYKKLFEKLDSGS